MLRADLDPANRALCSKRLHCVLKGESAWAVRTAAILLDVLPHKWFVTQWRSMARTLDKVRVQVEARDDNGKVTYYIDITIKPRPLSFTMKAGADSVLRDLGECTVTKYCRATMRASYGRQGPQPKPQDMCRFSHTLHLYVRAETKALDKHVHRTWPKRSHTMLFFIILRAMMYRGGRAGFLRFCCDD
jgi:hypothetical protein